MGCPYSEQIQARLWRGDPERGAFDVFAVLDGARDERIQRTLFRSPSSCCVENRRLSPAVRAAAPQLVRLRQREPILGQLLTGGWGESWGIYAISRGRRALEEIRRHFHSLLRVESEDGRALVFRYYDPRVLREILPTCSRGQLEAFFGPIREYWLEDEGGEALLRFTFDGKLLYRTRIDWPGGEEHERAPEPIAPYDA